MLVFQLFVKFSSYAVLKIAAFYVFQSVLCFCLPFSLAKFLARL